MNKNRGIPLGLLFKEPVAPISEIVVPVYDEVEGISVIVDENGNKKPYVEWAPNLGTKTETRVAAEGTDEDENTPGFLGTKTVTAVKAEQTDDDDYLDLPLEKGSMIRTKTVTKLLREESDDDV
jgi:hypothetical protein